MSKLQLAAIEKIQAKLIHALDFLEEVAQELKEGGEFDTNKEYTFQEVGEELDDYHDRVYAWRDHLDNPCLQITSDCGGKLLDGYGAVYEVSATDFKVKWKRVK